MEALVRRLVNLWYLGVFQGMHATAGTLRNSACLATEGRRETTPPPAVGRRREVVGRAPKGLGER
jgi:hypothetical protein